MRSCNGRASCNCAIAVRSGDDVIVVDICGVKRKRGKKIPLKAYMYLNGDLTSGTSIISYKNGINYKVKKEQVL